MPTAAVVVGLLLSPACDDKPDKPPRRPPKPPSALVPPQSQPRIGAASKPLARLAISYVKRANAAAAKLASSMAQGTPDRAAYLKLRQNVNAAAPLFRIGAKLGAEVLFGKPRSATESGGALSLLDAALAANDLEQANGRMREVSRSLRMIDNELTLQGVPSKKASLALSDQCFELGLVLLEANESAAAEPDAVLADARGMLDGIEQGARLVAALANAPAKADADAALKRVTAAAAPLRLALDRVKHARQLRDRAQLVQQSGAVGAAVRGLARAVGLKPALPYLARYPVADNQSSEIVTPLTLPAAQPDARGGKMEALAAIGKRLFSDKRLSKDGQRSCASCHQPAKAFSDGLAVPETDAKQPDAKAPPLRRNTPTLLYGSLQAAWLWDGKFAGAERQAFTTIHTFSAMGLSSGEVTKLVAGDPGYAKSFDEAFRDGVNERNLARALLAYEVSELVPGRAPIDRFARGEPDALDEAARRGLDVFVAAGRCARCHIPPLWGGSRPTAFATPVYAALGVPEQPGGRTLDGDPGRGAVSHRALDDHAFKTPTLRNVERTAPYFHHGKFATLEAVLAFYEKGGGKGLGIAVDTQDRDVRPLSLSAEQKADLLAFMRKALSDTQD